MITEDMCEMVNKCTVEWSDNNRNMNQDIRFDNKFINGCSEQEVSPELFVGAFGTYSRHNLQVFSGRFAQFLISHGVKAGENVGIIAYDSVQMAEAFWGIYRIGAVSVVISTLLREEQVYQLLLQTGIRVVLVSGAIWRQLVSNKLSELFTFVVLDEEAEAGALERSTVFWSTEREKPALPLLPCPVTRDAAGMIFFTSGSTGQSKAVICPRKLIANSEKMFNHDVLHLGKDDLVYSTSKMFVMYGMSNTNYGTVTSGARAVMDYRFSTVEVILENIEKYRPTVLFSIPTVYERIMNYCRAHDVRPDLSSLRICVSGGEPLGRSVGERWKNTFGVEILEGIGGTEAGHFYITNRLDDIVYGSVGYPLEGCRVRLANPETESDGSQMGVLEVSSDNVSLGYFRSEVETAMKFRDGWYNTGDVLRVDTKGRYWFLGRSDDLLKISGIWISPFLVEERLKNCTLVDRAFVSYLGKDNEPKKMCCIMVPNEKACQGLGEEEICRRTHNEIRHQLESVKCPRAYVLVPEIPATGNGKTNRKRLWQFINENETIQSRIIYVKK